EHRIARMRRECPDPFIATFEIPHAKLRDECAVGRFVVPGDSYAIIESFQAGFVGLFRSVGQPPLGSGRRASLVEQAHVDLCIAVPRVVPRGDEATLPYVEGGL